MPAIFSDIPSIFVDVEFAVDPTVEWVLGSSRLGTDTILVAADTVTWTDVSAYCRGFSIRRGRQHELGQIEAGRATIILNNRDRRFEPEFAASPYYPNVVPMRRVRIRAAYPPGVTPGSPAQTYADIVLTDLPSLFLEMQETSGTNAVDASGGGHAGTYGSGCTVNQANLDGNAADKSVSFDKTANGRVTTAYAPFVIGSSRTFEGWAIRTDSSAQMAIFGNDTAGNNVRLDAGSGVNSVTWTPDSVAVAGQTWSGAMPAPGTAFHWALTWNDTTHIAELFINGISLGTKAYAGGYNASSGNVKVGAYRSDSIEPWLGRHSHFAVYTSILSAARILAHYNAGPGIAAIPDAPAGTPYTIFQGYVEEWPQDWSMSPSDGQVALPCVDGFEPQAQSESTATITGALTGTMIQALLDLVDTPLRAVDVGSATSQTITLSGAVLAAVQMQAATELGYFFYSREGFATFHDRTHRRNTVSVATFTDSAGGTNPYTDITLSYTKNEIRNSINVSPAGLTTQSAEDSASITKYQRRSYSISTVSSTEADAAGVAALLRAVYKDPHVRVTELTLRPRMSPTNLWPKALAYDLGTRITTERHPPAGGAAISGDSFIEGLSHDYVQPQSGTPKWTTKWNLGPTALYETGWVLGGAALGTGTILV